MQVPLGVQIEFFRSLLGASAAKRHNPAAISGLRKVLMF